LIGMAFGLGFVLGPLIGGLLLSLPVSAHWRLRIPFLVAACFSTLAWVLVVLRLPESLPAGTHAREAARVLSWRGILDTIRMRGIGSLVLLGFLSVLAFAALEGTLALFLRRRMGWDPRLAAFAFAGLGLLSALVQGGLIRRIVPRFGEPRLIVGGIAVVALGFAALALVSGAAELAAALALVGLGQGLLGPSISGLLSRITPASEQGAVFGTLTSAQTFARMVSYSIANMLLGRASAAAPYWFGLAAYLVAGLIALKEMSHLTGYLEGEAALVAGVEATTRS
jgi:DHA1 family tetracycline resistance protein-like MFS transporter